MSEKLNQITPAIHKLGNAVTSKTEAYKAPNYTHRALGMYKLKENIQARYVLVEIPYNPETGETGAPKELARDIREDVIDKFKIMVDENKFFSSEE